MSFQSMDNIVQKLTAATPQFYRSDWHKMLVSNYVANRWYDLSLLEGRPTSHGVEGFIGNWIYNGHFNGGSNGWTLADAGWSWVANTMRKVNAGAAGTLTATMNQTIENGVCYRLVINISAIAGGNLTVRVGGAGPAAYSTTGVKVAYLTAVNATALVITPSINTMTATIDSISVTAVQNVAGVPYGGSAFPLSSTSPAALDHGGDVSPATKHVLNVGGLSINIAPGRLLLVDQLLVYAGLNLNTGLAQSLATPAGRTLPRYTDGKGVRAYLVSTQLHTTATFPTANGAVPQNIAMSYTNTVPTAGKTMPVTVASTVSSVYGHILHAGINPNNYGPFLPLAAGDLGITSVESLTMSAATTGDCALVLCKPLLNVPLGVAGTIGERDLLNALPSLPRVYDGANLQWLYFAGIAVTAPGQINGYTDFGWSA